MASFTLDEVKKHTEKDDLWVTTNGRVYNVTDFAYRHPGGMKIMHENGGRDVEELMQSHNPHKHSKAAYTILEKYYIGDLDDGKKKKGHKKNISYTDDQGVLSSMQGLMEDELVDWSKPIYYQVGKLGKNYFEWVHSPIDRHMRLFDSDFCEFFSVAYWWMVPMIWGPLMLGVLYWAKVLFDISEGKELWMPWLSGGLEIQSSLWYIPFVFGIFLWTFIEYVIHRWVFHLSPPHDSPFLIRMHFIFHGQHHKTPMDHHRLVFPPIPATCLALVLVGLHFLMFPPATAMTVMSGVCLGYMGYDLIHYYLHHGAPATNYFKELKRYHVKHHFVNQQKGFGISSKLWDYPFGTLLPMDEHKTQ